MYGPESVRPGDVRPENVDRRKILRRQKKASSKNQNKSIVLPISFRPVPFKAIFILQVSDVPFLYIKFGRRDYVLRVKKGQRLLAGL